MSPQSEERASLNLSVAIREILTPIVGDFVARASVNMASKRIGKTPETIGKSDLELLAEALRPALRTVVGVPAADALIAQIRELGS